MSHSSPIAAALGLPPNACKHPDPAIRRAYWAEVKRRDAARRLARAQFGRATCAKMIGAAACGCRLDFSIDHMTGRTAVHCPNCERRRRGLCLTCPRKIVGDLRRGASWCDLCRPIAIRKRKNRRERANPEWHAARTRGKRRRARRKLLEDLASPIPEVRAAAEARHARQLEVGRACYARYAAKRKAMGLPVNPRNRRKGWRAQPLERAA